MYFKGVFKYVELLVEARDLTSCGRCIQKILEKVDIFVKQNATFVVKIKKKLNEKIMLQMKPITKTTSKLFQKQNLKNRWKPQWSLVLFVKFL